MGFWGTLCGHPKSARKVILGHCHQTNLPQTFSPLSTYVGPQVKISLVIHRCYVS